jgi:SpoVK/Ycf46/Vps4 family AAA+-type ATPase
MAPCVVFLDEVDKAGIDPRQAGGDSGVSKRVMGSILTFMQESTKPMFWILTANRPDSLPPELLRKGRMDEVFSVLPPNQEERAEILRIHLRKRKQKMLKVDDLQVALEASRGYVGAEIEAAIKECVVDAYTEGTKVNGEAIKAQLACMKPISIAFKEDFDRMAAWASNNARPSSLPEPAKAAPKPVPTKVVRRGRIID